MKRPVTNRDKSRSWEMNLQTNLLTNIAPPKPGRREREVESRRKGADLSNVFAVCLSKHVPESWNTLGNIQRGSPETVKREKEKQKKRKKRLSLIFMNKLE